MSKWSPNDKKLNMPGGTAGKLIKLKSRQKALSMWGDFRTLYEPYYGHGEIYEAIYKGLPFTGHVANEIEEDVASASGAIHTDCLDYIQKTDIAALDISVADFDAYGVPLEQVAAFLRKQATDCLLMMTVGNVCFRMRPNVRREKFYYGDTSGKKFKLDWKHNVDLPKQYVLDACDDLGFRVEKQLMAGYHGHVNYFFFFLRKE